MRYDFEFTIPELPPTINAIGRSHWRVKAKNARKWKEYVDHATRDSRPYQPLQRAYLTYTRYSTSEPDFDNLVISFKHVADGLIESKIIVNDTPSNILKADYRWVKALRGQGKITVRVQEAS